MSEKRRGLGRGLGALIPSSASAGASGNGVPASRPVDLFFPEARKAPETLDTPAVPETEVAKSSPSRGSSAKSTTAAKTPAAKSPSAKVTTDEDPSASEPSAAPAAAAGKAVSEFALTEAS